MIDSVLILQTDEASRSAILKPVPRPPIRSPDTILDCQPHEDHVLRGGSASPDCIAQGGADLAMAEHFVSGLRRIHARGGPRPAENVRSRDVSGNTVDGDP
jgi:hypothetical protein